MSPAYSCYLAFDPAYGSHQTHFWISLVLIQILAWLFIALAARKVVCYRESAEQTEPGSNSAAAQPVRRQPLLTQNPVFWLARSQPGQKALIWWLAGLRVGLGLLIIPILAPLSSFLGGVRFYWPQFLVRIVGLIFCYAMAAVACRFFVEGRRNGMLELLLSTPLSDRMILDGLRMHLKKLLAVPLLCIVGVQWITWLSTVPLPRGQSGLSLIQLGLWSVTVFTEAMALSYLGMWLALSSKKPGQSAFRAFTCVSLIPYLFCATFPLAFYIRASALSGGLPRIVPMVLSLGNPLLPLIFHLCVIFWARSRLEKGIRAMALAHLTGESPPRRVREKPDPKTDFSEPFSLLK
jgi:hypothetical protein